MEQVTEEKSTGIAALENDVFQLWHAASKDALRSHLCGVWLDYDNKHAIACDGYILAMTPIKGYGLTGKYFIPAHIAKEIAQAKCDVLLNTNEKTLVTPKAVYKLPYEKDANLFAITKDRGNGNGSHESIAFNPDLALRLKKAFGLRKEQGIKVIFGKDSKDAIKVTNNYNSASGLLMPMKG